MRGIGEWATQRARLSGDRIAFVSGGRSWTYREFEDRTNRLANQLRDRFGIRRGDRIAAVIPTSVECLEILFAASKLGACRSPVCEIGSTSARSAPRERVSGDGSRPGAWAAT